MIHHHRVPAPNRERGRLSSLPALAFTLAMIPSFSMPAWAGGEATPPMTVVEDVDLERYAGLWYEVAKIPNRFQDQCAWGTTAEYTLREDGRIDVVNSCYEENGDRDRAEGVARVVDEKTRAKLEVSFVSFLGWRPFWGDYWILGLDADYQWAVVGSPDREYGWILSRTPELDAATSERIFGILRRNGYDPADFQPSPQTRP